MNRVICFALLAVVSQAAAAPIDQALDTLQSVSGVEAATGETQQAWRQVAALPPSELPRVLAAMGSAGPTAQNWLRMATDAIVERAEQTSEAIPQEALLAFLMDTTQSARGRRTAYEYLLALDPTVKDRLLQQMLDDPSLELRYDSVAWFLTQAEGEQLSDEQRKQLIERAFQSALNLSQLKDCQERLEDLGEEVDLTKHMGFVTHWKLIGPFDNTDKQGFDVAYSPEEVVDINKTYAGKAGPVAWQPATGDGDLGKLDLTKTLGPEKGAVAYAFTTFYWSEDKQAEVRYSTPNATKVWVNDELVCENEVYHSGDPLDQYRGQVNLKRGENKVLVKVCQNEQTDSWAQSWTLQFRFTDQLGKGLNQDKVALDPNAIITF